MHPEPGQLLQAWIDAVRAAGDNDAAGNAALDLPAAGPLLGAMPRARAEVLCLAVQEYCRNDGLLSRVVDRLRGTATREWHLDEAMRALIYRLLRGSPALTTEHWTTMLTALSGAGPPLWALSLNGLLRALEAHVAAAGLAPGLRAAAEALRIQLEFSSYTDDGRADRRLELLLALDEAGQPPLLERDAWGEDVLAWLEGLAPAALEAWGALLLHAGETAGRSRASQRWRRGAAPLVEAVGRDAFARQLERWMEAARLGPGASWGYEGKDVGISDRNQDVLKGLIWAAADLEDEALAHAVGRFAERCFRKIPQLRPRLQAAGQRLRLEHRRHGGRRGGGPAQPTGG